MIDTSFVRSDGTANKSLRGPWGYRVGLVGKPSAGKSSLFNALTRAGITKAAPDAMDAGGGSGEDGGKGEDGDGDGVADDDGDGDHADSMRACGWGEAVRAAKVGATPFTTIEPNIGIARFAVPADAEPTSLVSKATPTTYGRAADGRRLLPVTLIDVAGLVPGAYCGRGKG